MAQMSRIVLVLVAIVLTLMTSNGAFGFSLKNRKLRTLSHTQQQQKEASSVGDGLKADLASASSSSSSSSSSLSSAVSSEEERRELVRLEYLNREKLNALNLASQSASESVSMIESWHRERLSNDESMWSSLSADEIRTGFNMAKDTPVVMPQNWQLMDAGIRSFPSSKVVASALEVESKVDVNAKIAEFLKGTMCWKSTTQRGIGTIPNACTDPTHPSYEVGLCYKACASDEHGVATMCIKNSCQTGYTNYGLTCTYTAGPLLVGKGCCCTVFGCCNKNCGYGYQDDGACTCRAITYGISSDRGVGLIPTGCPSGRVNNAGLCYNQCPTNYVGLATTCWSKCSGTNSVDCGAACASDTGSCASGIVDMVTGPLTIVLNVLTGGELGAAVQAGKAAALTAVKDGAKAMVQAAAKRIAENVAKNLSADGVKATIKDMATKAASNLKDAAIDQIFSTAQSVASGQDVNLLDTALTTIANVDPTGIASTVMAFAKPMC